MYRYPTEQLMTVEEAERLSGLRSDERRERRQRELSIWAWQTLSGALNQTVTDEQVAQMARLQRRKWTRG